jgi:membrane protein DedA with SNARE-associated domain
MSKLEYRIFAAFAYPGAAIWVASFLTLGYVLGDKWQTTFATVHRYLTAIIIAIGVVGAAVWWLRRKRANPTA